jgi:hypothetical protein
VAAAGPAARALAHRLAALDDAALGALAAVAGRDLIVVLGDAAALPWIDGVVYLGRDDAAPDLLLPTALAPTVPARVLATAVCWAAGPAPIAVLPSPSTLVPCGLARAIDRGRLTAWRREAR